MDKRIITVKGTGKVSAKPDLIIILLNLKTRKKDYEDTMNYASLELEQIKKAMTETDFNASELKTVRFDIKTIYDNERDSKGDYRRVFKGYLCEHHLKYEIAYDTKRLGKILAAIAECDAKPELSLKFSVKDEDLLKGEMLKNAVENAAEKANTLAKSAKVKLGEILSINYSWGEIEIHSSTEYALSDSYPVLAAPTAVMDIEPEDVKISDTVTVVWAIKG